MARHIKAGDYLITPIFGLLVVLSTSCALLDDHKPPSITLSDWSRGVCFTAPQDPTMKMYLWFYEWNLFGCVRPLQHSVGSFRTTRSYAPDKRSCSLKLDWVTLDWSHQGTSLLDVEILDVKGARVLQTRTTQQLDVGGLAPGLYMLKASGDLGQTILPLIVK